MLGNRLNHISADVIFCVWGYICNIYIYKTELSTQCDGYYEELLTQNQSPGYSSLLDFREI